MTLTDGDIFLAINPTVSGDSAHFHIVVKSTKDDQLIVVYTTTKIEKVLKRCRWREGIVFDEREPETVVRLSSKDSDSFSSNCIVDCNMVRMWPERYFLTMNGFKKVQPLKNQRALVNIKNAIRASIVVEERVKMKL